MTAPALRWTDATPPLPDPHLLTGFERFAAEVDAIVVGEGRLDTQTGQGKIISAILPRNPGKPVHAVVGSVSPDLGGYAENFASITVASDADAMRAAGGRRAEALCVSRG